MLTNLSMKTKIVVATVAFVVAATGGAVAANAANQPSATNYTPAGKGELPSTKFKVPVGKTADGRTYGSGLDKFYGRAAYDLISVTSDSGKLGFVDRKAFETIGDDVPPDEAAAFRRKVDAGEVKLPVFDTDGKTQIDTFTIGASKMAGLKRLEDPGED
jgi:hypothetical protein